MHKVLARSFEYRVIATLVGAALPAGPLSPAAESLEKDRDHRAGGLAKWRPCFSKGLVNFAGL